MDDDELIARVAGGDGRDGDDTALRELFTRHAPWLAARLRTVLPPSDVEDVLQETFLAVWKGASAYRPQGSPGGWFWTIARNQAAMLLRKRGPGTVLLDPAEADADAARRGADVTDPAEAALVRADLAAATAALGPPGAPDREVWRLLYVEDRPVAEVAQLMGVPEGTVKSRAHRARRLLRAALGTHTAEGGTR
jgi:RNA polymerase sigma-70 factor, ECF subfamily